MSFDFAAANAAIAGKSAQDIIHYAIEQADGKPMVSTNFRPGEAVILHMCVQAKPDIPVLWVDHGYNTAETYICAQRCIDQLGLHIHLETPRVTRGYRDAALGGPPAIDDQEAHDAYTEEAKLEPFRRGIAALQPSVWLTALRREQTAYRSGLDVFSDGGNGLIRVSPFLDWTEADMNAYIAEHNLPDERVYFDPTKVEGNRECGLHPKPVNG